MHLLQGLGHPLWRVGVFDGVAQLLELFLLDIEVRLEPWVGEHGFDAGGEPVLLHEPVIEGERHREPVGDGAVWKPQRSQHSHIRGLDAERGPVLEADLAEGGDLRDREVPFRTCVSVGREEEW